LDALHLLVDDAPDLLPLLAEEPGHELSHLARSDPRAPAVQEALERGAELLGAGEAIARAVRDGAIADVGEPGVDVGDRLADPGLVPRGRAAQHDGLDTTGREALPGDRLPQHAAHAEDAGARVDGLPACLLGRDVGELALEHAALGVAGRAGGLGDAEVD